ncbi:MAG: phage tail tape measure protein, partial [Planctomycetaceae bacterium]|nr:phage tail tape measure protein [Planctomycetaceae bacterium]
MSGGNTTQGIQAGAIVINILGNNNQLNSVVNQTQQTLQKFKDGVGKLKIPGFQGIMATFRDLTVTFTSLTSSLRTLIAPLRQSATVFMSFDYNMSKVQAITGATAEQIAELREQAKLLGKTTFFTASQVADAQKFLAMAGFDPEKIKAALPNILNLALAGDMDIGMAADIATNISTPFKIAAQDLNRVNDVLAAVASSSNTNVLEMGQAFKYAAPAASAAGQSIEELGAAFAVLANNGLKADMAGTSVRMMLIKLT